MLTTKTSKISIARCQLRLARPLRQGEATAIRGFFGRRFEDEVHMHNHQPDGTPVYQYPRVQYKVVDKTALLIGVNEGSELLQRLWLNIDETRIGSQHLPVLESSFEADKHEVAVVDRPIRYKFTTPWMALNQKNHQEYASLKNKLVRQDKLARTLAGNCLGMCKSLGLRRFEPYERIIADCSRIRELKTTLKGQRMVAFVGQFTLNLDLPDHIGIGKSVSRGFGTIEKCLARAVPQERSQKEKTC